MGEIEAAIAREQLHKLPSLVASRQRAAARLTQALSRLPGLSPPKVSPNATHVYYVYGMTLDFEKLNRDRAWIVKALKAEGVTGLLEGYQNIHLNPLFRHRIAYGTTGFPWIGIRTLDSNVHYGPGLCPIAENLHQHTFFGLLLTAHMFTDEEIDLVISAFKKVWSYLVQSTKS